MGIEKRKERRVRAELAIKITAKNRPPISGKTDNISRLGTYVEAESSASLGQEVEIVLEIPAYNQDSSLSGKVQCQGNIFRSGLAREGSSGKYYGMGIFFTDFVTPADRDRLSRYIDFLILEEEKGLKHGLKRWSDKRQIARKKRQASKSQVKNNQNPQIIRLLNQILNRLEELSQLLKSRLNSSNRP